MPRKSSRGMNVAKDVGMLVIGLLILSNALWPYVTWGVFVGAVVAIVGFLKLVIPHSYE